MSQLSSRQTRTLLLCAGSFCKLVENVEIPLITDLPNDSILLISLLRKVYDSPSLANNS